MHKEKEKKRLYKKILATEWNGGEKIKIALKQNKRSGVTTIPRRRQQQLSYLSTVFCRRG
jgi:hypothetical protein